MTEKDLGRLEEWLRAGQGLAVRKALRRVNARSLNEAVRLPLANLARRAGAPGLGLKFLHVRVRPSARHSPTASPNERAEYAASLSRIGAVDEALVILRELGPGRPAEAALYEAFSLVARWDYQGSLPLLEEYLKASSLAPYQRAVGRANLAAALVHERKDARPLLDELLEESRRESWNFLTGKLLDLRAEDAIYRRQWSTVEKALNDAEKFLENVGGTDSLFIRKWRAVARLRRPSGVAAGLTQLLAVRKDAFAARHWETIRQCDLFEAIATRKVNLFTHLYFGTPYESFRKMVERESTGMAIPTTYEFSLGRPLKNSIGINVHTGVCFPVGPRLKTGQAMHRMLEALASDFYRPARLARLHGQIFPTDYYNPFSSPEKVHRVIRRTREWLQTSKVPLEIREASGDYWIQSPGIRLRREQIRPGFSAPLHRLASLFGSHFFTATQAAQKLGLSRRSTIYLLSGGSTDGSLERTGSGRSTRYRIRPQKP